MSERNKGVPFPRCLITLFLLPLIVAWLAVRALWRAR